MTDAVKAEKIQSDRELAAMFAPEPARSRLLAFYRWLEEVEDIPVRAKEPAIQAMRFAWHREAVADLFASPQKIRRHAAYEGLAPLAAETPGLSRAGLIGLIDALEAAVSPEPITDMASLLELVDAQHEGVMGLALQVLAMDAPDMMQAASRASGLAQWVRQFAFRAGRQLPLIPARDLEAAGLNEHRLATGREAELARQAFSGVIEALDTALGELQGAEPCPAEAFPVLGQARLARATLKTAKKSGDLYRTGFARPQFARQLDLIRASLTGRL
ncbi:squalene/phytoene synthase family protein [Hyphobacterium sp.]|uniref:squalene/phytoene synthase family protein n=1 Tax=Hyphobacterium sp. TaxID=2004662 RepID=UPI003BA88BFD